MALGRRGMLWMLPALLNYHPEYFLDIIFSLFMEKLSNPLW